MANDSKSGLNGLISKAVDIWVRPPRKARDGAGMSRDMAKRRAFLKQDLKHIIETETPPDWWGENQ